MGTPSDRGIVLVSPVRNEAAHIELTARSVLAQTRPPDVWVVVDDGSDDDTPAILRRLEPSIPFMRVLTTPAGYTADRGDRHAVAAAPRAFNWGLKAVRHDGFGYVGKLDGDIELPADYFERLLLEFERDATLGIGGGALVERSRSGWRPARVSPRHVRGALKLYSRSCFEAIGGIQERLGWDGVDETYARMNGFSTRSFSHIVARHHRPYGAADGELRSRLRAGETQYILRYPFPWVLAKSLKMAAAKPIGVSGVAFIYGYVRAAWRSVPRVESAAYRRFVRRELRRRVLHQLPRPRAGGHANA